MNEPQLSSGVAGPVDSCANTRGLTAAEVAWLAAVPCAAITIAAVVVLGPLVGDTFLAPGSATFWPQAGARPEPVQEGRFLIALLGPALLCAIVLANARIRVRAPRSPVRPLIVASQLVGAGVVLICFAAQNNIVLSADFILPPDIVQPHTKYFTWPTLLVACVLPLLALGLLRRAPLARRVAACARESPWRRRAAFVLAGLLAATWLLTAINVDSSIGNTNLGVGWHLLTSMNEPFAILDGRTPLVNYHAQYGQVWPYVAAAVMHAAGATMAVYTIVMASISGLAMLAAYAMFRRIAHSSVLGLMLFLPFLATSFFMTGGPQDDRYSPANLFLLWPVRYAGPFLLAWLTVRHLDGVAPRRAWLLFLVAGLVAVNNSEFGAAAFAGSLAAIACANPPRSRRSVGRLLGSAAIGLVAALALLSLLTLARSGQLPRFDLLPEFGSLYAIGGWAMLPMPVIGLHLAVFLTFVATLVVAIVRAVSRSDEPLLTGMLAWSGTFGLGASAYFAGRPHPLTLFAFFSPWSLCLALLLVGIARSLARRAWQRPSLPEYAAMVGFAIAICSIPQIPAPWQQIARIRDRTPTPVFEQRDAVRFVTDRTVPGEHVAILISLSHRIAYDAHVVNVAPYASIESMPTAQQLRRTIATMRAEHVRTLFVSGDLIFGEELDALQRAGFTPRSKAGLFTELHDSEPTAPA